MSIITTLNLSILMFYFLARNVIAQISIGILRKEVNKMAYFGETNPDVKAMRIRRIREKVKNGEKLSDDEEALYRESKHPRLG